MTLAITQPSSPAGAVLTCTGANPVTAVNGIATFAGCSIDLASTPSYRLHATVTTGPTATDSNPFAIARGVAAKLAFATQPSSSSGGIAFATQPVVMFQDAGGNLALANPSPVTLSIAQPSNPVGAVLSCTSANPRTPIGGVATFTGCRIDLASATTYSLRATVSTGPSGATSNALTITVGAPAQMVFSQQPSDSAVGGSFASQPQLTVQDAGGNTVTSDNSSSVTLDITRPSTPSTAVLACTSNSVTVTGGVASFSGCEIDLAGIYSLSADDTTHALTVSSEALTIT